MAVHPARRTALKIEQLSVLATVVVAFAALAALVLTGQAGLRQDLRAMQADTLAAQAELRAGQIRIREDLAALGVRLAVVEYRTDVIETRLAVVKRRTAEQPVADAPEDGSDHSMSPAGPPPGAVPSR